MGAIDKAVPTLYESDFVAWTGQQADALRRGDLRSLDRVNLIEEIESMGRQQQAELTNRLALLIAHLLKWQAQPELRTTRGRSWTLTVEEERRQIERLLRKNPSLRAHLDEAMSDAAGDARLIAARESELPLERFPVEPAFAFEQLMRADWMPG